MEKNLNPQGISENNVTKSIEPKLIGTATRQELIEREIIFDAPDKDVVLKVVNIQNEIEIKDVTVASGTVLVSGYLNSYIMYTTMKRPQSENNNEQKNNEDANNSEKNGYVNMQNNKSSENNNNNKKKNKEQAKPSCGVVDNSIALDGVLRHTTVWIPFKSFIPALEVQEGDSCTVTSSAILDNLKSMAVSPIYEEEYEEESTSSIIRGEDVQKFIKGVINKTLIELTVDIKRYPTN